GGRGVGGGGGEDGGGGRVGGGQRVVLTGHQGDLPGPADGLRQVVVDLLQRDRGQRGGRQQRHRDRGPDGGGQRQCRGRQHRAEPPPGQPALGGHRTGGEQEGVDPAGVVGLAARHEEQHPP